ncbi:alpha/beta fold hydrolase [Scytonema sp. UIC 10036]|uniref:YqiA/YcfP family alpha/beta fold hydrolase n=1 Tax=Scytonema sp. UIC 10036 TaxID=2304196 RepID=UPI0012DAF277|nr:YqiA/YcfP family alpha/beta fold hydrolase [Scytonema sp. UIC 10036]MUH00434.1 alpha/beta fold hydrolase [Scytonema sp. UIC 10036]
MPTEFIYLHGFASSPCSAKAIYLRDRFTQAHIELKIPDLNAGDFTNLTITRQLAQIALELPDPCTSVTLIGSSLGGLTAAHLGQQHQPVKRLVLLAPAFGFLSHWLPKLGDEALQQWQQEKYLMVHHYGEKRSLPLSYNFVLDANQYKEEILQRPTPTLILHGKHDEVIPIQASRDFALQRPWVELLELDSDHSLSNVMSEIWLAIQHFCLLTTNH